METILQAIDIMYGKISTLQIPHADAVIKPQVGYIRAADFDKRHEAILEDDKAASAAMPAIDKIIGAFRQEGRLP
jgi:NTE family protein